MCDVSRHRNALNLRVRSIPWFLGLIVDVWVEGELRSSSPVVALMTQMSRS
jgi:hypothetical protein